MFMPGVDRLLRLGLVVRLLKLLYFVPWTQDAPRSGSRVGSGILVVLR